MHELTKDELTNFLKKDFNEYQSLPNNNPISEHSLDFFMTKISGTQFNSIDSIKNALIMTFDIRKKIAPIVPPMTALVDVSYAISFLDADFRKSWVPQHFENLFKENE